MGRALRLEGKRFGRLLVVKKADQGDCKNSKWLCICDCGVETVKVGRAMVCGDTQSCGCYGKEQLIKSIQRSKRKPGEEKHLHQWWYQINDKAKRRGIDIAIEKDIAIKIAKQECFYCGAPPARYNRYIENRKARCGRRQETYYPESCENDAPYIHGLDRVDSSKGYTEENVVPCCGSCNQLKWDRPIKDFYEHLKKVIHHIESSPETLVKVLSAESDTILNFLTYAENPDIIG